MQITTARLLLRPVKHSDCKALLAILNQPECLAFNDYGSEVTHAELKDWIQWDIEQTLLGRGIRFVIEKLPSGEVVGSIGLFACDEDEAMEVGFELRVEDHHKGFMTESFQAITNDIEQLFLPYNNQIARVNRQNVKALKLLNKLSFTLTKEETGILTLKRTHHTANP